MRAFIILLLLVVNAFSLTLQDYLTMKGYTQVELIDNFSFGKWEVFILKSRSAFKTVAITDKTVKEFWGVPAITEGGFIKFRDFKLYPDGTLEKIEDKYPKILKEKRIGNTRFVLKKHSPGGLTRLYIQTSDIEKEFAEFDIFDFYKGDKYAYVFYYGDEYFFIYRLYPSEYIYDIEEIYKQKIGFRYRAGEVYCDGNVLVYFYVYDTGSFFGLLFDIKNEKVEKVFQIENWDVKNKKIVGCVNKKIYVVENFSIPKVYSLDLKPVKPVVVKLKEKGIKLSKTAFTLKGCVKVIKTEDYVIFIYGRKKVSNENSPSSTTVFDIHIFDKNFSKLKSISLNEGVDISLVDKNIYGFSPTSSCLFQIYPSQKQIKCSKSSDEEYIPAENGALIIKKSAMFDVLLGRRTKGYVKIEKEGKTVWEKHFTTKDKLRFLFTQKGIFVDAWGKKKFYFVDLNGNEKPIKRKLKLISFSSLETYYYDYRNMLFSDENYYYRFDFEKKDYKPIMKNHFINEDGKKQYCELSQNIVICNNDIYSLKDAKKIAHMKNTINLLCSVDEYILGLGSENNVPILKFFKEGKLVDYMPIKINEPSDIICLENGFLVINREGRWSHKCTSHIEYYRFED